MKKISNNNTFINTNIIKSPLTNKDIICINKEEKSLELKEISNKNLNLQSKSKISTMNSVETLQKLVNYTNKLDINSEIMLIIHADFDKFAKPKS